MTIKVPSQVQTVFDRFRQTGSLGPTAEKNDPTMDMMMFIGFRDNMEEMQALIPLDQQPGMDKDEAPGSISCTPAALQHLGKPPAMKTLDAVIEGPMADPDSVLIRKSDGAEKESYHLATSYNGAPAFLTAQCDRGQWAIGSNMMVVENGEPKRDDMGVPQFTGEFLMLK